MRDVRRTVRQGMWAAVAITVPFWLVLWNGEPILLALGQEPELAPRRRASPRAAMGLLPFLGFIVLRSFVSALERPGWAMVIGVVAVAFNALRQSTR